MAGELPCQPRWNFDLCVRQRMSLSGPACLLEIYGHENIMVHLFCIRSQGVGGQWQGLFQSSLSLRGKVKKEAYSRCRQ